MMFGSIFYNFWAALLAFTLYFFIALQKPYLPVRILVGSFVAAVIVFLLMFVIRFLINYILFSPEIQDVENTDDSIDESQSSHDKENQEDMEQPKSSTVEFKDESAEEVAQVVRTMMHTE